MELSRNSMEHFSSDLQKDLIELMKLQETLGFQSGITMGTIARFPGEEKIREWLNKARGIANKYHPQSFTVSVGIPLGAQVSFTWQTENK